MVTNPDKKLHIYVLNVGQGDTTVIISPEGRVILIDAKNPTKIKYLLKNWKWNTTKFVFNDTIEHLIITHPHVDHFSGANSLADDFTIEEATFAPFWHEFGMGPPTYRKLVDKLKNNKITNINFLSGYSRWYPDQVTKASTDEDILVDPDAPYLELLGPTNGLVSQLEDARVFKANHLSIMSRLTWKDFRMVISGDAQMENWGPFDNEKLLEEKCCVLRAAHHGSSNGTQWERLNCLSPAMVIISSDPESKHGLPDVASAAAFAKFDKEPNQFAVITQHAGNIHILVDTNGSRKFYSYKDLTGNKIDFSNDPVVLDEEGNPTNWADLVKKRIEDLYKEP